MDTRILSIVGLILVILIALMLGAPAVDGYTSQSSSLKEYPYEGFEAIQNAFEARYAEPFEANSDEKKKYAEAFEANSDEKKKYAEAFEANSDGKKKYAEAFEASESPAIKVGGFSGLMSGTYGNEKIIGFMYNNEASTTCKPYGYTNSKGNICLSPSDIKLLTTRGGNASGASDQIGK
jgi:hypothetical protein